MAYFSLGKAYAQAERFADLTGEFQWATVPVLWIEGLEPIKSIPLFGLATRAFWVTDQG
jgi:hypothetical protein